MKSSIIHILLIFMLGTSIHVSALPFSPSIKNFGTNDYSGGNQNWSVAQDSKGFVYVANNKGLLVYNGNTWQRLKLPLHFPIRSVFVSSEDVVYLGSYEEFGYLKKEGEEFLYISLKVQVKDFKFNTDEIWNIVEYNNKIYFQSFSSFFIYNFEEVIGIRENRHYLNLLKVNNKLYSQAIGGHFYVHTGTKFEEVINRNTLPDDIVGILPYNKQTIILATKNSGLYSFNEDTKLLKKFITEVDNDLVNYSINRTAISYDSVLLFGTLSKGLFAINKEGKLLWEINKDNKLINNTILGLYCDNQNNFWLSMDNGIAKVFNNSAIRYYESLIPSMGMVYDFLQDGNTSYFATNHGLYSFQNKTGVQNILTEQTWGIQKFDEDIICSHNRGSFLIEGNKAIPLATSMGGILMKEMLINNENVLLQSTYGSFLVYKKEDNKWKIFSTIEGSPRLIKNFERDYLGNIWAKKMYRDIVRFSISKDFKKVENEKEYEILKPQNGHSVNVMSLGKRIIFTDESKYYTYDDLKDSIVEYDILNSQLPDLADTYKIVQIDENNFWFISPSYYSWIKEENGIYYKFHQIKVAAPNGPIEGEGNAIIDQQNNCSYLLLNGGVIRFDHHFTPLPITPRLYIAELGFRSKHNKELEVSSKLNNHLKVKYNYNNFYISLANPVYNESEYKTIVSLDGLEGNYENISDFQYEYLRLPFGTYTFNARIVDYKGDVVDQLSVKFTIQPPYYLSTLAIIIYLLLAGLSFYGGVQYFNRRKSRLIERQKQQYHITIKEKENQLIALQKQQLEEEIRLKSKELSAIAIANIANRELLTTVQEELIQHKKQGINKDEIAKMLKKIESNIKNSTDDWNLFQENFDRVHENFFNKLKEEFPQLTSTDLRLCAFLRLNLTTKDISRLMNISLRGVEAGRYRLRKKFNLASDHNLTDFVMQFKEN